MGFSGVLREVAEWEWSRKVHLRGEYELIVKTHLAIAVRSMKVKILYEAGPTTQSGTTFTTVWLHVCGC